MATNIARAAGIGQTVGATTAVLAAVTLAVGEAGHVVVKCRGRSAAGDVFTGHKEASVKETGGIAALVSAQLDTAMPTPDAAMTTAALDIVVSGLEVRLRVTGVALLTIEWVGWIEVTR